MKRYVVRVWLPDRPGALGAVASRIGGVRGDLVGIDILERGGGRVIDELAVELPEADLLPLLLSEIGEVDAVDVEEAREVLEWSRDPRLDALESAAVIVAQTCHAAMLDKLVDHAARDFDSAWAAVVRAGHENLLASVGSPPAAAWLSAFVAGSDASDVMSGGDVGPDDVAWASLPSADAALMLGRHGGPFRARERRQLAALARIADSRWSQLQD